MDELLSIESKQQLRVYIVDPNDANTIRIVHTLNDFLQIKNIDGLYQLLYVKASYEIIDDSLHDGISCTHYKKDNSSKGECFAVLLDR